ncbi:hypothetical protein FQR65_LT07699 [Abscondita terminalis]|nr:hypothetical protein FQR65_LT07699 [Abscondita terminalis]
MKLRNSTIKAKTIRSSSNVIKYPKNSRKKIREKERKCVCFPQHLGAVEIPIVWSEFLLNSQLCDGVVVCEDGVQFKIHRVILSAVSSYFKAHFTNSLNRGSPENVEAKVSVPSEIFKNILDFAYTGCCNIEANNVEYLLKAADQYDVLGVVQLCCRYVLVSERSTIMFSVAQKVALITGGASGIGLKYAVELLKNGLRAVTLADCNEEYGRKAEDELREKFGEQKVMFVKVDVTDINQVEDGFKKTVEHFKNIDILINNAGIMNDNIWEKEIAINIKGTVNGTLLAIQNYIHNNKSGSEGVILNISSVGGIEPAPPFPIYCATKYAVLGFTRSFGDQNHFNYSGVRVFAICPGLTDTPLVKNFELKCVRSEYSSFRNKNISYVAQSPQYVARCAIELIKTAPHGSVWVIEDDEPPYKYPHIVRQEVKQLSTE